MSMVEADVTGRLVCDGAGGLYLQPLDADGNSLSIHADDSGTLVDDIIAVRRDKELGVFVAVTDGITHNDTFSRNIKDMNGTTGPLFDSDGKLVVAGDPHNDVTLPDDAHYDADAVSNMFTKIDTLPDSISPIATGHTESYGPGSDD